MDPNAAGIWRDWAQTLEGSGGKRSRDRSHFCKVAYRDRQLCVVSYILSYTYRLPMADNEISSLLGELSNSQKDSPDPASQLDTQQTTPNVSGVNTAVNYTLEPYEPQKLNTRRLQRRRNRANVYANELFLNQANKKEDFKVYYTITAKDGIKLMDKIDAIRANYDLERGLRGSPKKVSELRSGSLLIEVATLDQSTRIKQIRKIDNVEVEVQEHATLNKTRGTIFSKRYAELPDERLFPELAKYDVTAIYRAKRKVNEQQVLTGLIVLTFDRCELPPEVKIGWNIFDVRTYIPLPRRCFKCQRFNHNITNCRAKNSICANCGEEGHSWPCENPANCANCSQAHRATDRTCPAFVKEKEIIATQVKEKVSYIEAKKMVNKRTPQSNQSYAEIVNSRQGLNTRTAAAETGTRQASSASKRMVASVAQSVADVGKNKVNEMRELTQEKAEAVLKECNTAKENAVGKDQSASKGGKVAKTKDGGSILVRDTIDISIRNTNSQSQSTTGKELVSTRCSPEQRQVAQPPVSPGPAVGTASLVPPAAAVALGSLGGMAVRPPRRQPAGQPLQTKIQASLRHAEPQQGMPIQAVVGGINRPLNNSNSRTSQENVKRPASRERAAEPKTKISCSERSMHKEDHSRERSHSRSRGKSPRLTGNNKSQEADDRECTGMEISDQQNAYIDY